MSIVLIAGLGSIGRRYLRSLLALGADAGGHVGIMLDPGMIEYGEIGMAAIVSVTSNPGSVLTLAG